MRIRLPLSLGMTDYEMNPAGPIVAIPGPPPCTRVAFAAAHVVLDPASAGHPRPALDMEATLAFRRRLWSLGLGVAEAMDTAQRGMGLDWEMAKELIRQSALEAGTCKGAIACGANTDQLANGTAPMLDDVLAAYEEQCAFIEKCGAQVILMASRALVRCARGPEDYQFIYGRLLSQLKRPAILHWLGEAFDPQLKGYWGEADADRSMEAVLELIAANRDKIDGIKISLLDKQQEIAMRRRLPEGVRMYTGDDFNYPELIRGDGKHFSHALLGIFDGIAPAATCALHALDGGDLNTYEELLAPTLPLSRHIFQAPTLHYKAGLIFLAYLNGYQNQFLMLGGLESARSVTHYAELFVLADRARVLMDPELAMHRMQGFLAERDSIGGSSR
jgi:Protein of unknown function (DUF993)